jgi:hypothetical protein
MERLRNFIIAVLGMAWDNVRLIIWLFLSAPCIIGLVIAALLFMLDRDPLGHLMYLKRMLSGRLWFSFLHVMGWSQKGWNDHDMGMD